VALQSSADKLNTHESGIISEIIDESYLRRFLVLGIEPGAKITVDRIAFFNGARIVNIDGNKFAMRRVELEMIVLK
jgi:Fe2+ transport system protein FeoA